MPSEDLDAPLVWLDPDRDFFASSVVVEPDLGILKCGRRCLRHEEVKGEVEALLVPVDSQRSLFLEALPCVEGDDEDLLGPGPAKQKAVGEESGVWICLG